MKRIISNILIVLFFCGALYGQETSSALESGFKTPPNEAKARTWWHWISGNVSKSGITKDLEAMKEVGIQEAQLFNVHLGFPQGSTTYLSEEWLDLFHFSAKEAKRLGLELAFHNGPGWSSSGGPWITPENAMQTVVYSEVVLEDGKIFKGQLPQPKTKLGYYRDIAILAFPKPMEQYKIDGLDYKNLSGRVRNHLVPDNKVIPEAAIINKNDIIDLTAKVSKDGFLDWKAPKGEWVILRLGHTPTGQKNRPAPEGGHGLECDKMSKKAVDAFWEGGIAPIIRKLGDLVGSVVNNCIIDSYEVGTTNWTSGFDKEFERLRSYNIGPYLPTLAGYYVDNGEVTERFLWDFRRTISDLMTENYYAHFRELCHENGMKFSVEPYWGPFENMQIGETGDIVMCEFWSGGFPFFDSPKFVSSIAHLNGSAIVGAEAFTGIGGWDEHPAVLKSIGDRAWAQGINRFIFHTYVHQPWDVGPGIALSYHGTDFNRLNTWWSQGKSFMDYIGRSQFLLQEGKSVSDVLVFTGESSPNNALLMPEIKAMGYDYDLIGSNKIGTLTVENGQIYNAVGDSYRLLVLPKTDWIRPETIMAIEKLAKAGATILGYKPQKSPSLTGYPECDTQVAQLADVLWQKGLVKEGAVLDFLNEGTVPPDFSIVEGNKADINFIHRKTEGADIYFVANSQKESRENVFRFRVTGMQPELWNAETGAIKDLVVWQDNGDGTINVPIQLGLEEAVFVVFRKPISASSHIVKIIETLEQPESEPLSNLKIIKAEYGSFLQDGLVDLTDKVIAAVKDNKLNIQAGRGFCDCDPAMGYKKEFRMEYKIGEEVKRVYVEEREFVNIDATNKGGLTILKAVFGKFKPETKDVPKYYKTFDVTNKIKGMVSSGILQIPIEKSIIEGNVAKGKNQILRVTFSTDGEERIVSVPLGRTLNLSKDISKPKLIANNGSVNWITPYAGNMSYTDVSGKTKNVKVKSVPKPIEFKGTWNVSFQKLETNVNFENLISWTESSNEDIRHFSGTASYKKEFCLSKKLLSSEYSLDLDLGSVAVIAEVFINGKNVGLLWKAPFRINIDDFVTKGKNNIEVKVTNLWPNRLIGDESLPMDYQRKGDKTKSLPDWLVNNTQRPSERTTFPSWSHYDKKDQLLTSGLLGPVKIIVSRIIELE